MIDSADLMTQFDRPGQLPRQALGSQKRAHVGGDDGRGGQGLDSAPDGCLFAPALCDVIAE